MLWSICSQFFLWIPIPPVSITSIPTIISITIIFMFHSFFSFLTRFKYFFIILLSFIFTRGPLRKQNFFLFMKTRSHFLTRIEWSILLLLFTSCEFFTPALTGGLSLKSEWQQVFSSLQDSSQYSCWSWSYCSLYNLNSSSDFQIIQFFFPSLSGPF